MTRGTVLLVIAVAALSAATTWMLVDSERDDDLSLSGDAHTDAARIAELEAEIDRLVEANRELQSIHVDREPESALPAGTDGASTEPVNDALVREATDAIDERLGFRTLKQAPTIPKNVPPGMRGTPKMWIDGMRIALEKGDKGLAHYYRMALVALGDEAVEPTAALVQNDGASLELRELALQSLTQLAPNRVHAIASDWLSVPRDASPMRTSMLRALSQGGADGVPKSVVEIAWNDEAPVHDRQLALRSTMRADPDEASDLIRRFLRDGSDSEQKLARQALPQTRNPALRPLVEDVMKDSDPKYQRQLMQALAGMKGANWDNVQMTGPPDTPTGGDNVTAWASKSAQEGSVWVELDFRVAVVPEQIRVHETFNPGAIVKVEGLVGGRPTVLWEGEPRGATAPRWFVPPLAETHTSIRTVRLTLNTDAVAGWNEIDAVELVGDGQNQWATGARSSSCYAHR